MVWMEISSLRWVAAAVTPIVTFVKWFTGRWVFTPRKCQDQLDVVVEGVGPHIYVNPGRSSVITGLNLLFLNHLPFSVKIDRIGLEISIESQGLTHLAQDVIQDRRIPRKNCKRVPISEHHLSDTQARIVRNYPSPSKPCDCPILRLQGKVRLTSWFIDEIHKTFEAETRAFVYRG